MTHPTAAELDASIHKQCHGSGNFHRPEWSINELFGSRLIKMSASEYALHIGRMVEDDDSDGRWGFVGNSAADSAFRHWPHAELRVTSAIPNHPDWSVSMSCDALSPTSRPDGSTGVRVGEGKNFEQNAGQTADGKVRNAIDQAALWQAFAWHQVSVEQNHHFPLSPFVDPSDPWAKPPFDWPEWAVPDGVVVACFPNHNSPRLRMETLDLSPDDLDNHRCFYLAKADAILTSAKAIWSGMAETDALAAPGGALDWDRTKGFLESLPPERRDLLELPDVEEAMLAYAECHAALKAAEAAAAEKRAILDALAATHAEEFADGDGKWKHRLDSVGSVSFSPGGAVVERKATSYVSKPSVRFTPARSI